MSSLITEDRQQPATRRRQGRFFVLPRQANLFMRVGVLFLAIIGLCFFLIARQAPAGLAQAPVAGHTKAATDSECLECHSAGQGRIFSPSSS